MKRLGRQFVVAGLAALCTFLTACGGGGGSPPPPPPSPLVISNQVPMPTGVVGTSYSGKLQASGGTPPYKWSTGLLGIAGLTLSSDGSLTGSPSQPGTFIPTFTVTDAEARIATGGIEIDIITPLIFQSDFILDQNVALPVWTYVDANGGKPPYTFSLASGSAMPPGLTFSNEGGVGRIQGTPTAPGTYKFTIEVTDTFSPPEKVSQEFSLRILNDIVVPQPALPDAVQNLAYQEQIQPAGGTPPYHFALAAFQTMPKGLTLDASTGKVTGTPTVIGDGYIQVTITDSAPTPGHRDAFITLNVKPPLSVESVTLPDSARGLNYFGELRIAGGRAPYTAKITAGALPDGVSITQSPYPPLFNVNGSPTKDGLFAFTVQIADSYETPNSLKRDFDIRISDQMNLTGPYQGQVLYNQTYTTTFPITGGFPPYSWSVIDVPPGFTFDTATGTLSGGPTGKYSYTSSFITAQDSSNPPLHSNYLVFSLTVYDKLQILTKALPPIAAGSAAAFGLQENGGFGPYSLSLTSGALPTGMKLDLASGFLTGTPATPGTYPVTLTVSDANTGSLHQTTTQDLTINVVDRSQLQRNDTIAGATPLSSVSLLASISPYSEATGEPDVDVYKLTAKPGTIVYLYVFANNDFQQPPRPNALYPVMEVVDATDTRHDTCSPVLDPPYTYPCVTGLDGSFFKSTSLTLKVPGSGTAPVTFYVRISDAHGNARPDFIYTLHVYGVD